MRENSRLGLSIIISILIHVCIFLFIRSLTPKISMNNNPTPKKLENLLVIKRGSSQDPSKNQEGAPKPSKASTSLSQGTITSQITSPMNSINPPPKPQKQKQKDSEKKALDTYQPSNFDPRNLSILDPNPIPSYPSSTEKSSKELDDGLDSRTAQEINQLYGEEFGDLGTAQQDFIKNNLRNIGRITQRYLSYPKIAAYFEQSGVNAVEFVLHPNGDITDLKIIKSSGLSSFDQQTTHTIKIAYKDYPRPTVPTLIRIHVTYSYYGY